MVSGIIRVALFLNQPMICCAVLRTAIESLREATCSRSFWQCPTLSIYSERVLFASSIVSGRSSIHTRTSSRVSALATTACNTRMLARVDESSLTVKSPLLQESTSTRHIQQNCSPTVAAILTKGGSEQPLCRAIDESESKALCHLEPCVPMPISHFQLPRGRHPMRCEH